MKLTDEQQAVVDAVRAGHDCKVTAVAGAGKSTTVFEAAKAVKGDVLYLVFNRSAADDARAKAGKNTEVRTIHSLAYERLGRSNAHRLPRSKWEMKKTHAPNGRPYASGRVTSQKTAQLLGITGGLRIEDIGIQRQTIARIASETIDNFCYTADGNILPKHVPRQPKLTEAGQKELAEKIAPLARKIWKDTTRNPESLHRYTFEIMLKQWALTKPLLEYDAIMLDEAQDSNGLAKSLIMKQSCQKIAVGDSCQQLYAWRGASDILDGWPGLDLTLSQSWRFGEAIAEQANLWLPHAHGKVKVVGNPNINSKVISGDPDPDARYDAILCRSNAMCVQEVMGLIEKGITPAIAGGTDQMRSLLNAANDLKTNNSTDHPELYVFTEWEEVEAYSEEPQGSDLKVLVKLVNRHGAKRLLWALSQTVDEDSDKVECTISTAHKSKGLEWDRVKIASDFENPLEKLEEAGEDHSDVPPEARGPLPTLVDEFGQEIPLLSRADAMLGYVAVTRAAKVLDNAGVAWIADLPVPAETH